MDYHSDRFDDFSLMIYEDNKLVGLIPANRREKIIHSHEGLTYGGLFLNKNFNLDKIFQEIKTYLNGYGIQCLEFRTLPSIYQNENSKSFIKYLNAYDSPIFHTNKILAIDYAYPLQIHKTKIKHYRKNFKKGFEIKEENSLDGFWNNVLIPRLERRHKTKPVHTLDEITLLKSRFIEQIKQYNIYLEGKIMAGITIFDKGHIVKSQYGATNDLGENQRALEYLFIELIFKYKEEGKRFFSMGTVMDKTFPDGYNTGLMRQKIELGCSEYRQDFYRYALV